MIFDPLYDHYPFVLKNNEEGNILYYRGLMLYFRWFMEDGEFSVLLERGYARERLTELTEQCIDLRERRIARYYTDESRKYDGREVYFWGAGAAWRQYRPLFAKAKPVAMLLDGEFLQRQNGKSIDGIPVRDPEKVLNEKSSLPLIVFARAEHAEAMEHAIRKICGDRLQGQPQFFLL
jgi:hypothetical protein